MDSEALLSGEVGVDRNREKREYWNPLIETLPREKLIQIELKRFRELL
jgi:hypothetical protein